MVDLPSVIRVPGYLFLLGQPIKLKVRVRCGRVLAACSRHCTGQRCPLGPNLDGKNPPLAPCQGLLIIMLGADTRSPISQKGCKRGPSAQCKSQAPQRGMSRLRQGTMYQSISLQGSARPAQAVHGLNRVKPVLPPALACTPLRQTVR